MVLDDSMPDVRSLEPFGVQNAGKAMLTLRIMR